MTNSCKFAHCRAAYFVMATVLILATKIVSAQVVDEVIITQDEHGYEIEIAFFKPLRYQSHSPQKVGKTLEILLRPENITQPQLSDRKDQQDSLSWDRETGIPLQEILFDGGMADTPSLILRFDQTARYQVRNSRDLRSIIIKLESEVTPKSQSDNLVTVLKTIDPKRAAMLTDANQAMLDKNYRRAVLLFTKIRELSNDQIRPHVQELLGVARELNGQLAHAKAEYLQFLQDYPNSKDVDRVKQRLNALITAAKTPKQKLRAARHQKVVDGSEWDSQFYGSFSQVYYRDQISPENQNSQIVRSDLASDLDFIAKASKGELNFKGQFIGSYREDFRSDKTKDNSEFRPSIISVEAKHSGTGLYARIGRQSRTTGGVLGRFDGVHTAYEINSKTTLNAIYGYPVISSKKAKINTEQTFYGVSLDVGTIWDGWDLNSYYIAQQNAGIKDREAVGGEIRYFDPNMSFFTLLDYDISYQEVNIFLLLANWTVTTDTSLNLVLDYRNSPILTTTNAIQGQGVDELQDLFERFDQDELRQLAKDRTAASKSVTTGITHQLSDDMQIIGEVSITEIGETVASGGVEANPGTDMEYFYSVQLIANKLVFDNDMMILGVRLSDTERSDSYQFNANWRINASREFRINPRFRIDYRQDKSDDDNRWLVRPSIRMDYRFKKWVKLELDIGYEWLDQTFSGQSTTTTGYFFSAGYRAQF